MITLQKTIFALTALLFLSSLGLEKSKWLTKYESSDIKIEFKKELCTKTDSDIQNEYAFLKVTNKTSSSIVVSFDKEAWFEDNCLNCGSFESKVVLNLKANESVEASCSGDKVLKVFSSKPNVQGVKSLTRFEVTNIKIEK